MYMYNILSLQILYRSYSDWFCERNLLIHCKDTFIYIALFTIPIASKQLHGDDMKRNTTKFVSRRELCHRPT